MFIYRFHLYPTSIFPWHGKTLKPSPKKNMTSLTNSILLSTPPHWIPLPCSWHRKSSKTAFLPLTWTVYSSGTAKSSLTAMRPLPCWKIRNWALQTQLSPILPLKQPIRAMNWKPLSRNCLKKWRKIAPSRTILLHQIWWQKTNFNPTCKKLWTTGTTPPLQNQQPSPSMLTQPERFAAAALQIPTTLIPLCWNAMPEKMASKLAFISMSTGWTSAGFCLKVLRIPTAAQSRLLWKKILFCWILKISRLLMTNGDTAPAVWPLPQRMNQICSPWVWIQMESHRHSPLTGQLAALTMQPSPAR